MNNLTYRQLLIALQELPDEQLDMTATVVDTGRMEAFPISETTLVSELPTKIRQEFEDVLEFEQPVIVI